MQNSHTHPWASEHYRSWLALAGALHTADQPPPPAGTQLHCPPHSLAVQSGASSATTTAACPTPMPRDCQLEAALRSRRRLAVINRRHPLVERHIRPRRHRLDATELAAAIAAPVHRDGLGRQVAHQWEVRGRVGRNLGGRGRTGRRRRRSRRRRRRRTFHKHRLIKGAVEEQAAVGSGEQPSVGTDRQRRPGNGGR